MEDDEILDYDPSAYEIYHKVETIWPCLTLDILKDDLGACRNK